MKKYFPLIFFVVITGVFFAPFIFKNKLPIPADTIIGLYHPFRDLYSDEYPNGISYKNFLITDPVRQQIPWKNLAVDKIKSFEMPLWNPYNFAGTPLLANFQTGTFYPFNILFLILPFSYAWSFLIFLQPVLGGFFLYLFLKNLRLNKAACLLGGFVFSFSGFSMAWIEWGTVGHTALWLPLSLLSIDKLFLVSNKFQISNKKIQAWSLMFVFSFMASFFAGHLQTFFYLFLISTSYILARWFQFKKRKKVLSLFAICYLLFAIITSIQWLPTLQLIGESARNIDQIWQKDGWFVPWQHLIQFIAPDFFGNPATLNYWGVWNYAELVGYVGIFPLIMALFALFYRQDRKTFFFGTVFFLSLILALPTILAKAPYLLEVPFVSTTQPTRLLYLTDFSLAVLAALGMDKLLRKYKVINLIVPMLLISIVLTCLWIFVTISTLSPGILDKSDLLISKRNLILPTIFVTGAFIVLSIWHLYSKSKLRKLIILMMFSIVLFDLLRFGIKFTPFTESGYFFPSTKSIEFLQNKSGKFRTMSIDDRIMPPNFSAMYRIESLDGYDPLYLRRYAELITAIERERPDISPPFGFNRIITPKNFESRLIDMMGVKYILSLNELESDKLREVFRDGQTIIYENNNTFISRIFFVEEVLPASEKKEAIEKLFDQSIDLRKKAIVEEWKSNERLFAKGDAEVIDHSENKVVIDVSLEDVGFLVFMDSYYPTWDARICDNDLQNCIESEIYITNYNFRGIVIPEGQHRVIFVNNLL